MPVEFAKLGEVIAQAVRDAQAASWPIIMELTNKKRTILLIDSAGREIGKIDLPHVLL